MLVTMCTNTMILSGVDLHRKIDHNTRVTPSYVHFTWYAGPQTNYFRFHHLISVLAAHKYAKPERIYFWFDRIPEGDYFKELKERVPELFLIYREIPPEMYGQPVEKEKYVSNIIRLEAVLQYGGMYFDLDVIVVKPLDPLLKYDVIMGYEKPGVLSNRIIMGTKWAEFLKMWHMKYKTIKDQKQNDSVDVPSSLAKENPHLIHIEENSFYGLSQNPDKAKQLYEVGTFYNWKANNIYAMHMWTAQHTVEHNHTDIKTWDTTAGFIFREIYYGNSSLTRLCLEPTICKDSETAKFYIYKRNDGFKRNLTIPVNYEKNITHKERVVPSLVHFIWFSRLSSKKKPFLFKFMIGILAAHKFVKPDKIFLWIDTIPEGDYFNEVQQKVPELYLIRREVPTQIFGKPVNVPEHKADVLRMEAILEFGGMYFDLDSIVVKPLDPLLRYETVMGYETTGGLCNGVIIAKPWAEFIKVWYYNYKTFNDRLWSEHSIKAPARIAKRHRNLIHTEKSSICRPNWTSEELGYFYDIGKIYDWKKNNYVMHIWSKWRFIICNRNNIKTMNNTIGEIFRYIYYGNSSIIR